MRLIVVQKGRPPRGLTCSRILSRLFPCTFLLCFSFAIDARGQVVQFTCLSERLTSASVPAMEHTSTRTINHDLDGDGTYERLYSGHTATGDRIEAVLGSAGRSYIVATEESDHRSFDLIGALPTGAEALIVGYSLEEYSTSRTTVISFFRMGASSLVRTAILMWTCERCSALRPMLVPLSDGTVAFLLGNTTRYLTINHSGACSISQPAVTPSDWTTAPTQPAVSSARVCLARLRY